MSTLPPIRNPYTAEAQLKRMRIVRGIKGRSANGDQNAAETRAEERHQELLDALAAFGKRLQSASPATGADPGADPEAAARDNQHLIAAAQVMKDLEMLAQSITETKREIAALSRPGRDDDRISTATLELDAVVQATQEATESILEAAETIDATTEAMRIYTTDSQELENIDRVAAQVVGIFEACNFQDITGQRVTKVVKALQFIEERIDRMIEILGGHEEFKELIPADEEATPGGDAGLLHGPQLAGDVKISQDDIDKMFD